MKSFKSFAPKTVFITLLLINGGNGLFAQKQPGAQITQAVESRIRFTGSQDDMLLFDVQPDNLPAKGTELRILNESGDPIFAERISATSHSCRYRILPNDMEVITFTISGKAFYYNQSFTINRKTEERLEVKQMK